MPSVSPRTGSGSSSSSGSSSPPMRRWGTKSVIFILISVLRVSTALARLALTWVTWLKVVSGTEFFASRIRIKEFKYFNPWLISTQTYDPGCSSRIRILIFYPFRIPDPRVKKAPYPGSASATLVSWHQHPCLK